MMKKMNVLTIVVVAMILTFLRGVDVQAKESREFYTYLSEYNADSYVEISSQKELTEYFYSCFLEYKGAAVVYTGEDFKEITLEDVTNCIYAAMQKDVEENINDCESLWGNMESYKRGIAVMDDYTVICAKLTYKHTKEEMEQLNTYLKNTVVNLNRQYHFGNMTVTEKAKIAHDFIIENFDYDETFTNYTDYDAVYNLIDGKSVMVCQGYSLMYYKLLNLMGVDAKIIVSDEHSWNLVRLEDGKWYHVDVTNDDMGVYGDDTIYYEHFLKNELKGEMYEYLDTSIFYNSIENFNLSASHITSDIDIDINVCYDLLENLRDILFVVGVILLILVCMTPVMKRPQYMPVERMCFA